MQNMIERGKTIRAKGGGFAIITKKFYFVMFDQGMVLHQLGNNNLAEKVLRDAVNAEPTSSVSW